MKPPSFVTRLVALVESELGDLEDVVAGLPSHSDPAVAPREVLGWLAAWQGFDVPARVTDAGELRALLARIPELNERRATPAGLVDLIELHAGVRPLVFEAFRARGVWTLGERSELGVDTTPPGREVGGFVVGEGRGGRSGPDAQPRPGGTLFDDWAHRVTVLVAGGTTTAATRRLISGLVEREKPAHIVGHVCFAGPRLRVGLQARVGLDALVGGAAGGGHLDSARLDVDARTVERDRRRATAGENRLDIDMTVG